MNSIHQRLVLLIILLSYAQIDTYGQRFYSVVFSQLPKDNQLYARDDNNIAEVPISGFIEIPGWDHFSVITYRNGQRVGYHKSALNYGANSSATFEMKPTIKAELADYSFAVYACKLKDSVFIVERREVVGGDFFVISGQSNAAATIFGSWTSKYARTIARIPDNTPTLSPADTLWIPSAWSWTYVGAWGLELQKNIIEQEGIPTCVINGSLPGAKLNDFLARDEKNPANSNSLYGLLLKRVNIAKPKRIRAFFWVHGEQEIFEYLTTYPQQYDLLYKNWMIDYPTVERFIVLQANVIVLNHENDHPVGGAVRDFLRRTKYLYEKTDHFTPIATPGYDGVHYSRPGYEELGVRLFRFIRPRVYNSTDTDNVSCPDIIKAAYATDKNNEIILTFEEGQQLRWGADTTVKGQDGQPLTLRLKDFFYLDGDEKNPQILSGKVEGNKVILTLKGPVTAKKINYLPSFLPKNLPEPLGLQIGTFFGPFLTNKRGLGAFSFIDINIEPAPREPILAIEPVSKDRFWSIYPNPTRDILKVEFPKRVSGEMQILSIAGRDYYRSELKEVNSYEVDITKWPTGVYILNLKDSRGAVVTQKIIKQ
jgi:hypothetical protein